MTKCPSGADFEFYTFHTFQQHHNLNTGKLSTSSGLLRHIFSSHYVPIMEIAPKFYDTATTFSGQMGVWRHLFKTLSTQYNSVSFLN